MTKTENVQLAILFGLTLVVGILIGALGMAVLGPEARRAQERERWVEGTVQNHLDAMRAEEMIDRHLTERKDAKP